MVAAVLPRAQWVLAPQDSQVTETVTLRRFADASSPHWGTQSGGGGGATARIGHLFPCTALDVILKIGLEVGINAPPLRPPVDTYVLTYAQTVTVWPETGRMALNGIG